MIRNRGHVEATAWAESPNQLLGLVYSELFFGFRAPRRVRVDYEGLSCDKRAGKTTEGSREEVYGGDDGFT